MKRNTALKILNPILGLLALNQIFTGVLGGILPPFFMSIHKTGGITFATGAVLHVTLNWNWVKANFFKSHSAAQQ